MLTVVQPDTSSQLATLKSRDVFLFAGDMHILVCWNNDIACRSTGAHRDSGPLVLNLATGMAFDMNPKTMVQPFDATLTINGPMGSTKPALTPNEESCLRYPPEGQTGKIACIKLVRERLNLGLREAKEYVETAGRALGFNI